MVATATEFNVGVHAGRNLGIQAVRDLQNIEWFTGDSVPAFAVEP
jgi:hypothetical protein